MHELSLAQAIYHACREAVRNYGEVRLDRVKVAVGDLSAVEPELLAYTWQAVTADGPDAGARLEIDWRPARQFCPQCLTDKPRPESSWLPICPDCGSPLTVEGGSELTLLEVSFLAEEEAKA